MSVLYADPEVLWSRVARRLIPSDSCLVWPGCVTSRGYGCVAAGRKGRTVLVHRLAVIVHEGPIPDGMTVDHLCMVKRCANPDHLEVVTTAENVQRYRASRGWHVGGVCSQGHALSGANLYRHPRGQLVCRTCAREQQRLRRLTPTP